MIFLNDNVLFHLSVLISSVYIPDWIRNMFCMFIDVDYFIGLPPEEQYRVTRLSLPSLADSVAEVLTDMRVVKYFFTFIALFRVWIFIFFNWGIVFKNYSAHILTEWLHRTFAQYSMKNWEYWFNRCNLRNTKHQNGDGCKDDRMQRCKNVVVVFTARLVVYVCKSLASYRVDFFC